MKTSKKKLGISKKTLTPKKKVKKSQVAVFSGLDFKPLKRKTRSGKKTTDTSKKKEIKKSTSRSTSKKSTKDSKKKPASERKTPKKDDPKKKSKSIPTPKETKKNKKSVPESIKKLKTKKSKRSVPESIIPKKLKTKKSKRSVPESIIPKKLKETKKIEQNKKPTSITPKLLHNPNKPYKPKKPAKPSKKQTVVMEPSEMELPKKPIKQEEKEEYGSETEGKSEGSAESAEEPEKQKEKVVSPVAPLIEADKNITQLQQALAARGLPTTGDKTDLIGRLVNNPSKGSGGSTGTFSSTATEVRSPTSTYTEVRSPTSTSTDAYTAGNVTVTGGAGAGANTTVNIYPILRGEPKMAPFSMNKKESLFPGSVDSAYAESQIFQTKKEGRGPTIPELKEELKKRGLSVEGTKDVLINRLAANSDPEHTALLKKGATPFIVSN